MKMNTISKHFQDRNIPLELVKCEGYFYFVFDDKIHFHTKSIYVAHLNQLSVEQWIQEGNQFINEIGESDVN